MEAIAKLRNSRISPRKMRLVADSIRGLDVVSALTVLKYEQKHASEPLRKLLLSAVANWQSKHEDAADAADDLFVKTIMVNSAGMLKRFKPAPQGRAMRIRKRSNHVTIVVSAKQDQEKPKSEKKEAPASKPKQAKTETKKKTVTKKETKKK